MATEVDYAAMYEQVANERHELRVRLREAENLIKELAEVWFDGKSRAEGIAFWLDVMDKRSNAPLDEQDVQDFLRDWNARARRFLR